MRDLLDDASIVTSVVSNQGALRNASSTWQNQKKTRDGGCWFAAPALGMTCARVCAFRGGFDTAAIQHTGNDVGFHFWPTKLDGTDWMSVECSSTDNDTSWGANGDPPDPSSSHPACYVSCACNN